MIQETFEWLKACIQSCKFPFQLDSCHVLLQLFKIKFEDQEGFKESYDTLLGLIASKEVSLKLY